MVFWKRLRAPEHLRSLADEALCREVTKGNQDAFLALFDRYWNEVFRLACSILRNTAEAEDLVQSLFLEVHTTMLRYDEERGSFRTLLLRYTYTRAIDRRRHLECRQHYSSLQLEELEPEVFAREGALALGLSFDEGARLIEQGLAFLDEKQRAAVTSYFFRGLSINEIAEEIGDSFGNTRHHLYRGLERMRKILSPKGDESAKLDPKIVVKLHRRLKRAAAEVSVVRARPI